MQRAAAVRHRSGEATLRRVLDEGGIRRGGILLVHAGFRALGQQGLAPDDAVDVLLNSLSGGGTLLMPAMSWRTVTPENPVFDELRTPGHVGILSETFRLGRATHRSLHPTHSVIGCGPLADFLLSTHQLGCTPVPLTSPYGKMRGRGAQILMLGTDLETATVFHHPEELIAPHIYLRDWSTLETYALVDRRHRRHEYRLLRHRRVRRAFEKFRLPLKRAKALVDGSIDGVPWTVFDADRAIELTIGAITGDANATLAAG